MIDRFELNRIRQTATNNQFSHSLILSIALGFCMASLFTMILLDTFNVDPVVAFLVSWAVFGGLLHMCLMIATKWLCFKSRRTLKTPANAKQMLSPNIQAHAVKAAAESFPLALRPSVGSDLEDRVYFAATMWEWCLFAIKNTGGTLGTNQNRPVGFLTSSPDVFTRLSRERAICDLLLEDLSQARP